MKLWHNSVTDHTPETSGTGEGGLSDEAIAGISIGAVVAVVAVVVVAVILISVLKVSQIYSCFCHLPL